LRLLFDLCTNAVEFCYRYGRYFQGVHWLDAPEKFNDESTWSLKSRIETGIAACGLKMILPNWPDDQPEQVKRTLSAWKQNGPRLVILDNIDDVGVGREILERLKDGGNLCVLFTTRQHAWPRDIVKQIYLLKEFKEVESLEFLRKYLKISNGYTDADLLKLSGKLGYFPLALELAGRYLMHTKINVAEYLLKLNMSMMHPSMNNWKPEYGNPTGHDLSIRSTFLTSWEALKGENTRKVFFLLSWYAPVEFVPLVLLKEATELELPILTEAVTELENMGLIDCHERSRYPMLHPLVSEFGQIESKRINGYEDLIKSADTLSLVTEFVVYEGYFYIYDLRKHLATSATHAEMAGLYAAARLYHLLGHQLNDAGEYQEARQAYEHALSIAEKKQDENPGDLASILSGLGMVLMELGESAAAKQMTQRALDIADANLNSEYSFRSTLANNAGLVLMNIGDTEGALRAFNQVLDLRGEDSEVSAEAGTVFNNLGLVLGAAGDYQSAQQMFEKSLLISEKALGSNHPDVARNAANFGIFLMDRGDYKSAQYLLEQALAIGENTLGLEHPSVEHTLRQLGTLFRSMGDYESAKQMHEKAFSLTEKNFGLDHVNMLKNFIGLGLVYYEMKDYEVAKQMLEQALLVSEKSFGLTHPIVSDCANSLGLVLSSMGDHTGAKQMLERALAIDEEIFGNIDISIARDANNMGKILIGSKDYTGAKQMLERSIIVHETINGAEDSSLGIAYSNLAATLRYMKDYKGYKRTIAHALRILEKTMPSDHPILLELQMAKKMDSHFLWVSVAVMAGVVLCAFVFPEWKTRPTFLIEYLTIGGIGFILSLIYLFPILKYKWLLRKRMGRKF
jgi:tetratricopeptide (TPR) repeat protein